MFSGSAPPSALAKMHSTASASGAARHSITSRLVSRHASSQATSTKNVFVDASAHPSYVSATQAYLPSRSGRSVAAVPTCEKDARAPPVHRAPSSALDDGADTTDQTVTNASPPRHGRPSSGSRLAEPSRTVFLKHRGVFGAAAAYVAVRSPASSAEKAKSELAFEGVSGGPVARAASYRGSSKNKTTSSLS